MPVANWNADEAWDILIIEGQRMPGVARVEISLPSGLDVRKANGSKKATVADTGTPAAILNIELVLLHADMQAFESMLPTLRPRGVAAANPPLTISHPNAKLWGINTVKIADIDSPMPMQGGHLTIKIKAFEHIEEPKKVKKVTPATKGDWDVQPKTDALRTGPSQSGAAEKNFSEDPSGIPGSGF